MADPRRDESDLAANLLGILERHRGDDAPDVPADLLAAVADIEQQNQFDDDRRKAQKAIREIVGHHAQGLALKEAGSVDAP